MTLLETERKIRTREQFVSEIARPLNNRQMATKQWRFNIEPELTSLSPLILYPRYIIYGICGLQALI